MPLESFMLVALPTPTWAQVISNLIATIKRKVCCKWFSMDEQHSADD